MADCFRSSFRVMDGAGEEKYRSHYKEEGVDDPNFVHAFNAYSKYACAI